MSLNSENENQIVIGIAEAGDKFLLVDKESEDDENINPSFILETLQAGRQNKTLSSPTQIKKRRVNSVSPIH